MWGAQEKPKTHLQNPSQKTLRARTKVGESGTEQRRKSKTRTLNEQRVRHPAAAGRLAITNEKV